MIHTPSAPRFGKWFTPRKSALPDDQLQDLQTRYATLLEKSKAKKTVAQVEAIILEQSQKADPATSAEPGILRLAQVKKDVDGLRTLTREKLWWFSSVRRTVKKTQRHLDTLIFLYDGLEHALTEASYANKFGKVFKNLLAMRTRDLIAGLVELSQPFGGLAKTALDHLEKLHQAHGAKSDWLSKEEQDSPKSFGVLYLGETPPVKTEASDGKATTGESTVGVSENLVGKIDPPAVSENLLTQIGAADTAGFFQVEEDPKAAEKQQIPLTREVSGESPGPENR